MRIYSTYHPWSPHFDDHPEGRDWPGAYADYPAAWAAVRAYLFSERWTEPAPGRLAPFGHRRPTVRYGDTVIFNDAETIKISQE